MTSIRWHPQRRCNKRFMEEYLSDTFLTNQQRKIWPTTRSLTKHQLIHPWRHSLTSGRRNSLAKMTKSQQMMQWIYVDYMLISLMNIHRGIIRHSVKFSGQRRSNLSTVVCWCCWKSSKEPCAQFSHLSGFKLSSVSAHLRLSYQAETKPGAKWLKLGLQEQATR